MEAGLPAAWLTVANKLVNFALDNGFKTGEAGRPATQGVLYETGDYNGNITSTQLAQGGIAADWCQMEVMKATANFAILRGRTDLWQYFDEEFAAVQAHYVPFVTGPNTWGTGYHETMMLDEMLRLESIPEPATLCLLAIGGAMMLRLCRR